MQDYFRNDQVLVMDINFFVFSVGVVIFWVYISDLELTEVA